MNDIIVTCPSCGVKNRIPADKQDRVPKCGRCGQVLRSGSTATVVELDDRKFDQVVGHSSLPVLVDFYSPTCGPCRMMAPVIENLARAYAGRAVIAKLDTSRHQMTAARFQIRGVPTLLFFKNNKLVDQVVGAVPQPEIEQRLKVLLS